MDSVGDLWAFLLWGYPLTVALEAPVLFFGLAPRHSLARRVGSAFWLTACSYPIVVLVLPLLLSSWSRGAYLVVAEVTAPLMECCVFWAAFPAIASSGKPGDSETQQSVRPQSTWIRDGLAIVAANLFSFSAGELMRWWGWIS